MFYGTRYHHKHMERRTFLSVASRRKSVVPNHEKLLSRLQAIASASSLPENEAQLLEALMDVIGISLTEIEGPSAANSLEWKDILQDAVEVIHYNARAQAKLWSIDPTLS